MLFGLSRSNSAEKIIFSFERVYGKPHLCVNEISLDVAFINIFDFKTVRQLIIVFVRLDRFVYVVASIPKMNKSNHMKSEFYC